MDEIAAFGLEARFLPSSSASGFRSAGNGTGSSRERRFNISKRAAFKSYLHAL